MPGTLPGFITTPDLAKAVQHNGPNGGLLWGQGRDQPFLFWSAIMRLPSAIPGCERGFFRDTGTARDADATAEEFLI